MTPPDPAPIVTEADRESATTIFMAGDHHVAAAIIARIRAEAYRAGAEAALKAVEAVHQKWVASSGPLLTEYATALARKKLGLDGS